MSRNALWVIFSVLLLASCQAFNDFFSEYDPDSSFDPKPIDPEGVTYIDARSGGKRAALIFETSGNERFGRFLSEYLLIVYNTSDGEPSIRLNFRPDEKVEKQSTAVKPLRSAYKKAKALPMNQAHAGYLESVSLPTMRISSSKELCSVQLFRMPRPDGVGGHVSKTGRLITISEDSLVRVWVDEEIFGDRIPCQAVGREPEQPGQIPFERNLFRSFNLLSYVETSTRPVDQLSFAHLDNIANETSKAYKKLAVLGEVSDIDSSKTLEVFISPDVNRTNFFGSVLENVADNVMVRPIYRPQDLSPYNSNSNALSNEGEIIYLWSPDPAGIYTYNNIVSSNMLTSNYAKGYIAYQLMSMIIHNNKYMKNDIVGDAEEDSWVRVALSLLASAYVGGNDFTNFFLDDYLMSRTQTIDLYESIGNTLHEEQMGMLAIFGWYLHIRLCGINTNVCEAVKQFIDNEEVGAASLEKVFTEDINSLFLNFGLSVATHVADKPDDVFALWEKGNASQKLNVESPVRMFTIDDSFSSSTEISPIPTTVEQVESELFCVIEQLFPTNPVRGSYHSPADPDADLPFFGGNYNLCHYSLLPNARQHFVDQAPTNDGAYDRTHAAPFPRKDNLFYHVLLPDTDMDIQMARNSISYILVTGFINDQMEVKANIGRGLQVLAVPLGDRDSSFRVMYNEKPSEFGHMDARPINLTTESLFDNTDFDYDTKTFHNNPVFPDTDMREWTLTPEKEIWLTGSIERFNIIVEDNEREIGDSDAYNIIVNPCPEAQQSGTDSCDDYTYLVLVQTKIIDEEQSYIPFVLATTPDLSIFNGKYALGTTGELGISLPEEFADDQYQGLLCRADDTSDIGSKLCDVSNAPFPDVEDGVDDDRDKFVYSKFIDDFGFEPFYVFEPSFGAMTFSNFLFSGFGYPIFNHISIYDEEDKRGDNFRSFLAEEANRQFFDFSYSHDLDEKGATNYLFFPVDNPLPAYSEIDFSEFTNVTSIELCSALASVEEEEEGEEGEGDEEELKCPEDFAALLLKDIELEEDYSESRFICSAYSDELELLCPDFTDLGIASRINSLFANRVVRYSYPTTGSDPSNTTPLVWQTFYRPMYLTGSDRSNTNCGYFNNSMRGPLNCAMRQTLAGVDDIRLQLDLPSNKISTDCVGAAAYLRSDGESYEDILNVVDVCIDEYTVYEAKGGSSGGILTTRLLHQLQTDRRRLRNYRHVRKSVLLGKEGLVHYTGFGIPYPTIGTDDDDTTIFNLIIGGLNSSEGNYVTRVKLIRTPIEPDILR